MYTSAFWITTMPIVNLIVPFDRVRFLGGIRKSPRSAQTCQLYSYLIPESARPTNATPQSTALPLELPPRQLVHLAVLDVPQLHLVHDPLPQLPLVLLSVIFGGWG